MIRRRDLVMGGLAAATLGTAEALRPRHRLILLQKNVKIEDVIPKAFGGWEAEVSSNLVSPEQAGRLARTLYSETVQRIFHHPDMERPVMLLAAYGDTQSDLLQLHRPESCYPAVGYTVTLTQPENLPLAPNAILPARRVVAVANETTENIVYWTRLGERIPQDGGQQRDARLLNAMEGYVADGILMRCSVIGDTEECFRILNNFIPAMLAATRRDGRPALIGTKLARQIA